MTVYGFEQETAAKLLRVANRENLPPSQGLASLPAPRSVHGLHGIWYTTSSITASTGSGALITPGNGTAKLMRLGATALGYYTQQDDTTNLEKTIYSFFPEIIASGTHVGIMEDTFGVLWIIAVYCP